MRCVAALTLCSASTQLTYEHLSDRSSWRARTARCRPRRRSASRVTLFVPLTRRISALLRLIGAPFALLQDKKLKKETRLEMFQKLQDMQAEMPSSLLPSLATAATLGSRQLQSYADKAAKLEDKHVRRALKRRRGPVDESASEGDSEEDWEAGKGGPVKPRSVPVFEEEKAEEPSAKPSWSGATIVDATPVVVGGALARGADGKPVAPVVVKRKAAKVCRLRDLTHIVVLQLALTTDHLSCRERSPHGASRTRQAQHSTRRRTTSTLPTRTWTRTTGMRKRRREW